MSDSNLFMYEKKPLVGTAAFLGIPLDVGKDGKGTDKAPEYLRKQGLASMCKAIGVSYKDIGDVACNDPATLQVGNPKIKYVDEVIRVAEGSALKVHNEVALGNKVVAIGGDHSIAFGTIAGASAACRGDLGLIWIDAHGDMMTHENTISGNTHGMPSAAALGIGYPPLVNIFNQGAKIKTENVLYIGLKDLDQAEVALILSKRLTAVTMMDLLCDGLGPITQKIAALQSRVGAVWVSLDIDSVDEMWAPATLMPNKGGLTRREITHLARYIGRTCSVIGMDIVEIAPYLDKEAVTAQLALELIAGLLGGEYTSYQQYMSMAAERQSSREFVAPK